MVKGARRSESLLGSGSATALEILHIVNNVNVNGCQGIPTCNHVTQKKGKKVPTTPVEKLVQEYDDLFHGIGKMKGVQVKLEIHACRDPSPSFPNIVST